MIFDLFGKNGLKMFKNIFRLIISPVVTKFALLTPLSKEIDFWVKLCENRYFNQFWDINHQNM